MVAVNSGPILHARDLPTMLMNHMSQPASGSAGGRIRSRKQRQPFAEHLHPADHSTSRSWRSERLLEAMRYTKGDRTMAANLLGIGRTTLYRKLKDYGVEAADLQ